MSRRLHLVALVVMLGACIPTLLWIGASGPPPPTPVQPQDNAKRHAEDAAKQQGGKKEESWWQRATRDPTAVFTLGILVFTAVLAASTIGLWIVTGRSANAAKIAADAADLSARAAVNIEAPIIRAFPDRLAYVNEPVRDREGYVSQPMNYPPASPHSVVSSIELRNVGRTRAFPVEAKLGWAECRHLADAPSYCKTVCFEAGDVIKETEFRLTTGVNITLTDPQITALRAGQSRLWFFCRLAYNDFMDEPREVNFCWRWGARYRDGHCDWIADADVPPAYKRKS